MSLVDKRNKVLQQLDMLDLIKREGWLQGELTGPDCKGNYITLCFLPMHTHDKQTPSLSIKPDKYVYKCFGKCSSAGSVFDMYMLMHSCSYIESVNEIAKYLGIIDDISPEEQEAVARRNRKEKVLTEVAKYYHKQCKNSIAAKEYLYARGLTDEVIESLKIGYANVLGTLPKTIAKDTLLEAGLLRVGKDGSIYPFFRKSIIFPAWRYNSCAYLSSRAIDPDATKPHLHLPLEKGENFEAFFNEGVLRKHTCPIIVEAPIDAASWGVVGMPSTAIMGISKFTKQSLQKVPKDSNVILGFDNDEAGIAGVARVGNILVPHCITIPSVLSYPNERKDANEVLVKDGTTGLLQCYDSLVSLSKWMLATHWIPDSNIVKNIPTIRKALATIYGHDPIETDVLLNEASNTINTLSHGKINVSVDILRQQLMSQRLTAQEN